MIATAKMWGCRPSAVAKDLFGADLPDYVTEADWYCFDVAATVRLQELMAAETPAAPQSSRSPSPVRGTAATQANGWDSILFDDDD